MTVFSHLLSTIFNENFKEPQILSQLIIRLFPGQTKNLAKAEGWLIHYLVGLFFVGIYFFSSKKFAWKISIKSGMLFGFLAGIFAVIVWHLTLHFHPDPPSLNHVYFYIQLVFAHGVFGIFMAWSGTKGI